MCPLNAVPFGTITRSPETRGSSSVAVNRSPARFRFVSSVSSSRTWTTVPDGISPANLWGRLAWGSFAAGSSAGSAYATGDFAPDSPTASAYPMRGLASGAAAATGDGVRLQPVPSRTRPRTGYRNVFIARLLIDLLSAHNKPIRSISDIAERIACDQSE